MCHPKNFHDMLKIDKESKGNGLPLRYLFNVPKHEAMSIRAIRSTSKHTVSLRVLLFAIYKINVKPKTFTYDDKAHTMYEDKHEYFSEIINASGGREPLISGMYGKSCGQLIRLSGVLHVLKWAAKLCSFLKNTRSDSIDDALDKELESIINKFNKTFLLLNMRHVNRHIYCLVTTKRTN